MVECNICNSISNHIEMCKLNYKIKDKIIEIEHNRRICDNCKNVVYDE